MVDLEKAKDNLQILYKKIYKWNLCGLYMVNKEIKQEFNKQKNQYGLTGKIKEVIIQWVIMVL